MSYSSPQFFLFLFLGALLYYLIPKKFRFTVLLAISYLFYISGGITAVFYLLFTTLTTYFSGLEISSFSSVKKKDADKKKLKRNRRIIGSVCLIVNFSLLFVVKYLNYTLDLFSVPDSFPRIDLLIPLGLSFYIFQSMGYIIDLVREKYPAQKNPLKFALFVSFFPQMTQGPISRYNELSRTLFDGNDFSFDNIKDALCLLITGYIKKLIIADRASVVAASIIDHYENFSGALILFGIIFYCIQLYCDFSGGIDIALGCAKLFGVTLPENFRRPIFSKSLSDFWRRWHITLGAWMRDYVFFTLSLSKPFINLGKFIRKHFKGKSGKVLPTSVATFIVYFIIGIWHGANFKYIVFGLWNGVIITSSLLLENVFIKIKKKLKINDKSALYSTFMTVRTNIIVIIGRYITRAAGISSALMMLKATFTSFGIGTLFDGSIMELGLLPKDYIILLVSLVLLFVYEFLCEKNIDILSKIEKAGAVPVFVISLLLIAAIVVFGFYRGDYIASEFIYRQF